MIDAHEVVVDGRTLTVATVERVARHGAPTVLDPAARALGSSGRARWSSACWPRAR